MNIICDLAKAKAVIANELNIESGLVIQVLQLATEKDRGKSEMEEYLWHMGSNIKALLLLNEAEANEELNRPTIPEKSGKSKS